jgi:glycerol-3-phosphate O-acyltransferase
MLREFGWLYHLLGLGVALGRVRFEDHSVDRIVRAAGRGPVVYVLLHRSALDHLALNTVLNRRRLPISEWAAGVSTWLWQPITDAWRQLISSVRGALVDGPPTDPVRSGWLARTVAAGHTVTIFLRDHAVPQLSADPAPADDPLRALLDAQADSARPLQLVPILCVWNPAPDVARHPSVDFLLGSQETPGLFSVLRSLFLPGHKAPFLQAGEPVDLGEFLDRTEDISDADRATHLRRLLRRFLKRESKVVRGPRLLPAPVMKQLVLDNPAMRQFAQEEAEATGTTPAAVSRALDKEYDVVAARFSFGWVRFCSIVMRPLWTRVFSGYDIREEDLERIRAASRRGAPVVIPCHKSHFDYLLISWIFFYADMIVPHVVAGINLAIWPVSHLLRALGGLFIRRSFTGERIHPVVIGRYIRELLRHGYPLEFFIEGGRTRTGLLLRPKLGVLQMVLDAAHKDRDHLVTLLPVAIAYEQVAEESSYREELGGAEKKKESMGQLIQARSVLNRRFGKVYVRVGEPVRAADVLGTPGEADDWGAASEEDRRARLQAVGDRLIHRIGQAMIVLPTGMLALALLAHHRQAVTHPDLLARVARIDTFLQRRSALRSESLARAEAALLQGLERFERDGLIKGHLVDGVRIWQIVPEQRVMLDFHKNQILHFFWEAGLVAGAVRGLAAAAHTAPLTAEALRPGWAHLRALLGREITFDPDDSDDALLQRGIDDLVAHGGLAPVEGGWVVVDEGRMGELHALMRGLLESYLVLLRAIVQHGDRTFEPKSFAKSIQAGAAGWLASGHVTRPEAMSSVALANGLAALLDMQRLQAVGKERRADPASLRSLLDAVAPMVQG